MAKEYTKKAQKEQQDLAKWQNIFAKLEKEEDAKAYIEKEVYKLAITKGCMVAYMLKYDKDSDKDWFKKGSLVEKPNTKMTIETDKDGKPIMYVNKDGKIVPKRKKVLVGGNKKTYDHATARTLWIEHYGIKCKATKFKPNSSKDDFDIFGEL